MASIVRGSRSPVLLTATLTVFLLFLLQFGPAFGQPDPPYVAVVRTPVATETNPTIIEVYTGDSQTASVTFDKAVLDRDVLASEQRYRFTENIPRVPNEAMTNISSEPVTLTLPTTMVTAARTGIYTITVTEGESPAVAWRVLVTNEAATIEAMEYSTGASMGDSVTVMVETEINVADLRWRRDGALRPVGPTGNICIEQTSCGDASASNSVVFECQENGRYSNQVHALINVIVRECPENMWSPPGCTNTCEPCINGGVCSDLTGLCLCPPGFSGNNCENIHGRNVFGQNAEYQCDDSGDDHADGCQGAIICYPDPLGCFCPAGYKGLNCTEACERGKFGANCKQECHCANNSLCALDTGLCEDNQCEDGWRGTNCQYGPCPVGVYGDFCNLPCSCSDGGDACSEVEVNCANGCAVPWTGIACDEDNGAGNIILTYVRVNSGQAANVTCTVIRNPPVAESDLVLSLTGTLLTADEDARSYNQTKVVGITLETAMEVTCSIRDTELMETILLMPYAPEKPILTTAITPRSVTFTISGIDRACTGTTVDLQEWNGTSWLIVRNVDLAETSVIIDRLIPCTHHSYRLSVASNGGEEFSDPVNSTTTSEALPSVRSLMVEAEIPGQLEVMWDPPDQSNNNCSVTSYSVSYRLLSYMACSSVVMEEEVDNSTMSTSHIIMKLKGYAQYSVTVRANKDLNGAENNMTAVTTISKPSDPPTNVLQNGSSTTELTFYWDPPPCESQNGVIKNYSYQLLQFNKTITEGTTESQGVVLVDLIPFTEYSFMVAASTSEGSGPVSDAIIVTTGEDVPGPPETVTLTNRTKTSITIEWDKPVNPWGFIINYQLQYRPIQKSYDQQFVVLEFGPKVEIANSGAHIVYQLTDLEPSTVYEIQLNAQTSAGEGEVVGITERTKLFTGLVPPFIPATIHGTETGTAVLILPALNQQYASGYYIRIKSELGQEQIKRSVDGVGNYDDNPGHYITAEVQKSEKEQSFTIGDGKEYGIYYNAPLSKGQEYQVFIGTGSKVGQDVSVVWSDPGLITEAKDANYAAFLVPTLTILAVVLLVTIVIGMILFRWYLRRKKSDPGATAAPSHVYASHIPLTTHGINAGDAEGDAYEVPKKTSFSALEKTGNCTDSDDYSNGGYVEYEISNKERESDSYDDVENGNEPGIKGSEMDCEVMDIGKATLDKSDLGNPNIRDRGPLPIIDMSPIGRSLDECYEELPETAESKNVVACRVKIKDLPNQLQDKNSVPEDTITDEFKKLPCGQQHPWTVGILKDENQDSGILPYDHSRVKLHKDYSGSDIGYINANYIKVQHPQTFIAAQDPTERTAEMFWKMVWFEKVEVIVNLSQPKVSSFQYWPISEGTNKIIGDYTLIWYKSSLEDLDLSIRKIKIGKGDKLHEVKLCHFLSWPDDRIPSQSVLFIDFIKKVKALKTTRSQPLLVHCNNGVGATGTFIALYCLMDDLKDRKKTGLSVSSFVNRMRKDRVNMIENEVQYWFLYDCLVVDLLSPEKTVQEDEINLGKQKDEFKILETCRGFSVKHSSIVGRQSHNAQKNRYSAVLPYDFSRAVLQTPGSLIGNTDYINATVINSCYSKDAFIMTQSPLPSTAEDFWRMVYDYNCAAIVCLNQRDENDETTCLYWPDSGKIQHGNMLVECTDVEDKDKYCSRRRLMVNFKNSKRMVTLDHYQLIEWSQDSDQTDGIIELIGKIKPITEEKRTIVVHCMDGASRCGVFVSVLLEISRIRGSKTGRLFETVLKLTGQNPHVMKSLDDYLLCHHLVQAALVEDESKYQEVK
ncbi:receptor-type tyrosine-protein phosphatase mu-like isoform X3 [Apostichopus japonicus]|uniref:receptor-type tyrosine-protein phosphatase mu-like isoform X3 n=1 Tax=Stichopus japonicus TaxID=307972 RepID=UPI003AB68C34